MMMRPNTTTGILKVLITLALWIGAAVSCVHAQDSSRGGHESAIMSRKLANIIIPNVEFRATTLVDAVEFLRQESRRLDVGSIPDARGINVVLKLAPERARITLTLSRVPLLEALKYVASQAGLKVKVEPYAVCLVPQGEVIDTMVTAVFRVSPGFFGNVAIGGDKNPLDQPATSSH